MLLYIPVSQTRLARGRDTSHVPRHPSEQAARGYAGAEQEVRWISSTRPMRSLMASLCALSWSSWCPPTACIRPDLNGSSCSQRQTHNVYVGQRGAQVNWGVPRYPLVRPDMPYFHLLPASKVPAEPWYLHWSSQHHPITRLLLPIALKGA